MDVMIFANYGVLAHEKMCVYTTAPDCTAVISEPLFIAIPDTMAPYFTASDDVALFVPDGLNPYLLREVLGANRSGLPVLRWIDKDGKRREYKPRVVKA